jgi:signal transduction histidine kinase
MQERVQALGGEFAIEAGNGRGTCVRIVIPLSQSSGAAQPAGARRRPGMTSMDIKR